MTFQNSTSNYNLLLLDPYMQDVIMWSESLLVRKQTLLLELQSGQTMWRWAQELSFLRVCQAWELGHFPELKKLGLTSFQRKKNNNLKVKQKWIWNDLFLIYFASWQITFGSLHTRWRYAKCIHTDCSDGNNFKRPNRQGQNKLFGRRKKTSN